MVDNAIVETAEEVGGDLSQLEKDLSQAVQTRKTAAAAGAKKPSQKQETSNDSQSDDDALPAKLKGKTPQQIAEMYVNLESAYGRMANDLGTQRKLTDRLLDLKRETDLGQNGAPAKAEIKTADLLENPTAALDRYSQAREQQNEQRLRELETSLAQAQLVNAHPDYLEIAQSAEFAGWVQASPIRVRAARMAQGGDYSAAGDLLTEYKLSNKAKQHKVVEETDADEAEDTSSRKAAQKASLEGPAQGNAGVKKGGKIYRRPDLMRLRAERPDIYFDDDFQREILLAYHEGRVK